MKKLNVISKILVYSLCALFVFMLFALANVSRETSNNNKININNYYADLMYVENVNYNTNTIMFKNSSDMYFIYKMETEIEDIYIGDFYNVVFYNNETSEIADDEIINFRYERPDLFDYNEIYYNIMNDFDF